MQDQNRLNKIKDAKAQAQEKVKGKDFSKLSTKEKDALLETLCRMFGLIK